MIKLPSKDPASAKIAFDQLMNGVFIKEGSPITSLADNPIFCYGEHTTDTDLVITALAKQELEQIATPVTSQADAVFSQIGEDFYAYTDA